MENKSIPELDKLFYDIGTYRESNDIKRLYEFVKKFPSIAPYNAMLLHIQQPGSLFVASAVEWQKRFNRTINPGARPLVILRPFGPVSFVFELGDTTGDSFPEKLLNPFKVEGKVHETIFNNLLNNLKCDGILYCESEHGTSSAGFIEKNYSNTKKKIVRGKKEILVKILFNMIINRKHPVETKFATIIHELAHLYCGHLGSNDLKWLPNRRNLTINEEEFEAESVCWLVCERMGIKNPSAEYLENYLNENRYIPNISIDTVLKAVANIESMINGCKEPRKELVLKTKVIKSTHIQQTLF
ncbi:hypothetical protein [Fictibacillus barbaricus]|uniref:IrrE N-terminal-like domain-containing protein n=1 Tax=Fictibacillus barbaricus TaxID=182136 RepID=A0ABS2ZA91_9BACL|nr:hypothetical protein [Fictibacillus barbaricus]MBN3545092.1 hypothetical protein [Fictibacillus barbaricus]GGB61808.1 hypothetical protein GCM10007199_29580 [Fictibacillus barbaricus]